MNDKIISAALGAMFGFALLYLANVWERIRRARRIVSALDRELVEVVSEIDKKLAWVGRDVSQYSLNEVDQDRIIKRNGIHLYLGEREEFTVPRVY